MIHGRQIAGYQSWRCKRCKAVMATHAPEVSMNCPACRENTGKVIRMTPVKSGNKYRAKRAPGLFPGGRSYDSNLERRVAEELHARVKAGDLRNLTEKEAVEVFPGVTWRVDFYAEEPAGTRKDWWPIRIEVKGAETGEYRIKRKLYELTGDHLLRVVKEVHGRRVVEHVWPHPRAGELRALLKAMQEER